MKKKLSVAFLWHMHQPLYKDLVTGKYLLPWVRLHSTYSYLDMAAILDDFPGIKCTFNLTPSLIWQLLEISGDDPVEDIYLNLSEKNAAYLSAQEKCFILKNFFSCDLERAIKPSNRYSQLLYWRGNDIREEEIMRKMGAFTESDIRDLQVLFNLAWCGFTLRNKDELVSSLVRKGEGFTEEDKLALLERQGEVVSSILPLYKRLQDEGRIEISTTPFYHPILPLLCNKEKEGQGFDFFDDAKEHVSRAVKLYKEVFKKPPRGMWPAEGGVSQSIIPLFADKNIGWIATDEGIVLSSFKGSDISRESLIYSAFQAEESGKKVDMVFRDINISNAISFRYSKMPAREAAADLLRDLREIYKARKDKDGDDIVSIILDGENPWPYYEDGGRRFLSEIYKQLSSSHSMGTVTIGDFLAASDKRKKIEKLYSGSWIDRNFRKWIGSPQKDKAWEYLAKARRELFASGKPDERALEELYIAEGSDWFWWYDEFGTELNFIFDKLFRMHLSNIYSLIGKEAPYYIYEPIPSGPSAKRLSTRGPLEMVRQVKVLMVSSEAVPFVKTGGLADVAGSLPRALAALGCDVRIIMPFYKSIKDSGHEISKVTGDVILPFPEEKTPVDFYTTRIDGVTVYFVEKDKYFARESLYGTTKGDYPDNDLRFSFFSKAVLGALKATDFKPDIIHCNDWQSALVPFYLKFRLSDNSFYNGIRTLFTIHNMAYQGVFVPDNIRKIGIPQKFLNMNDLEFYGHINFMKSGILYSDAVSTVSHRYAEEIMTPEYGCGLAGLLRLRKEALYGIPNGVDYSIWSPRNDRSIKCNYSIQTMDKKMECKKDLIEYTGLPVSPDTPLVGFVTRLAEQKGMDLVAGIMHRMVELGIGMVVLGHGSEDYNRIFRELSEKYPEHLYVCSDFNDELAHKIEAGCDIFVMPSRYEPCGLNQMYSIKYGTIPVVRATGGLDDVIVDFYEDRENSNGFKFGPPTEDALFGAVKKALKVYKDKGLWKELMTRAMSCDFSWTRSAEQYLSLYRDLSG